MSYVEQWREYARWVREGRLCFEDGHYGAAATAYTEEVRLAPTDLQRQAAEILRDEAAARAAATV